MTAIPLDNCTRVLGECRWTSNNYYKDKEVFDLFVQNCDYIDWG